MLTQHTTRREFLKGTGALIVGFTLAGPRSALAQAAGAAAKTVALDEVDSFLAVAQDGTVTVFAGKVDLGTGLRTALRQIAAEELEVPFDQVTLIEGDTALTPDQGPTWGSLTIQIGGAQIRQAAATARRALVVRAAERLGLATDNLEVKDGVIRSKWDRTVSTSYAELVGGDELRLKVDKKATWSAWEGLPDMGTLYDVVRKAPVKEDQVTLNVGDPKAALAGAAKKISATYEFPVHTHGSIGPSAAVAEWSNGQLTVWSASQAPHWLRRDLA